MNVSEITDERLKQMKEFEGRSVVLLEAAMMATELLSRRAAKVEKVEPVVRYYKSPYAWYAISNDKVIDRVLNDSKVLPIGYDVVDVDSLLDECTAAEYEAAKPKPAVDVRDARRKHLDSLDGDNPASVTITNPCGHGCNKVGIDCDNCADKPVKPNPQTAGEEAIAIEPLRGEDSGGLTYNAFQKINEIIEAVNRIREGK